MIGACHCSALEKCILGKAIFSMISTCHVLHVTCHCIGYIYQCHPPTLGERCSPNLSIILHSGLGIIKARTNNLLLEQK